MDKRVPPADWHQTRNFSAWQEDEALSNLPPLIRKHSVHRDQVINKQSLFALGQVRRR